VVKVATPGAELPRATLPWAAGPLAADTATLCPIDAADADFPCEVWVRVDRVRARLDRAWLRVDRAWLRVDRAIRETPRGAAAACPAWPVCPGAAAEAPWLPAEAP
jgi:hypothetical protein